MATVYNWVVSSMDEKPLEDGLTDVVVTVHWRRNATTEVDGKVYTADVYGTMACATPSETDFTAYPDLTFEQVCSWLDNGLDAAALDANLDSQLENQINPPIVSLPLPWAAPAPTPAPENVEETPVVE